MQECIERVDKVKLSACFYGWLQWYWDRKEIAMIVRSHDQKRSESLLTSSFHLWKFKLNQIRREQVYIYYYSFSINL